MRRNSLGVVSFDTYLAASTQAMGLLFPMVEGEDHRNFVLTFSDQEDPLIVHISPGNENPPSSFGGVTLSSDEDQFEFVWFEGYIYVILSNYAEDTELYPVLSKNPLEDWKWLIKTLFPRPLSSNSDVLIR